MSVFLGPSIDTNKSSLFCMCRHQTLGRWHRSTSRPLTDKISNILLTPSNRTFIMLYKQSEMSRISDVSYIVLNSSLSSIISRFSQTQTNIEINKTFSKFKYKILKCVTKEKRFLDLKNRQYDNSQVFRTTICYNILYLILYLISFL